ncbi:hypothetical protein D9758_000461 [Tetrapyrgos nigripes]|uniref:Uncharacterized protein n=1 Tax=Tetrapyrgos nigripes TaxID=182062 RepID=A0A8H5H1I5_9AGAR|nr:hypothetical protein D9758_000461 [Tetrapyrgos nigripes]
MDEGTAVGVDYILYFTPSFQTIVDKPVFPLLDATNNTTTSSPAAGPTSSSALSDPGSSKIDGGLIAGVTTGVIAFQVVAMAILSLWTWRRKQRKRDLEELSDRIPEPFMAKRSARTQPSMQEKHHSPGEADSATDAKGRLVLAISNVDQQKLGEHRDVLEVQIQQMEVQSQAGNLDQTNVEAERGTARVDIHTREMGSFLYHLMLARVVRMSKSGLRS